MIKTLKIKFIIAIFIASFVENSYSCELSNFGFGKTTKQVQKEYNLKQDILEDAYEELSIRVNKFCANYEAGKVIFSFFEDKLIRVTIDLESPERVLFQNLKKTYGEPTVKPNFNKIKDKVFATLIENENFIVSYKYQNTGDKVFETLNISPIKADKKLVEYLTKKELGTDDIRSVGE